MKAIFKFFVSTTLFLSAIAISYEASHSQGAQRWYFFGAAACLLFAAITAARS